MKKTLILSTLVFSSYAGAACTNKINPSKVVLFVDTNTSDMEIATAEKAACNRGERMVVVPKDYKTYKPVAGKSIKALTEDALKEIKASKASIQTFIISGHDGGGSFGGQKGGSSRYEMGELMKLFPEVNKVNSVLLLGCYTGVQKEIMEWKNIFPGVKLIGGYDGSAPLAVRPQGHQYITELLSKEAVLLKNADQAKLTAFTRANLKSIEDLNAAVYLNCEDKSKSSEFYFSSHNRTKGFANFDTKMCVKDDAYKSNLETYAKYDSGELEPPTTTASGPTRNLYNYARSHEHCYELMSGGVPPGKAFGLLFYDGMKKNYANFYKDDLAKVEKELSTINAEAIVKGIDADLEMNKKLLKTAEDELKEFSDTPEIYFGKKKALYDEAKKKFDDILKKPENAAYRRFYSADGTLDFDTVMNLPEQTQSSQSFITFMTETSTANMEVFRHKRSLDRDPESLKFQKSMLEGQTQMYTATAAALKKRSEELKANPESIKNFWIPTAENLSKKSRKETLQNIHEITKLIGTPGVPKKQRAYLSWTASTMTEHLQHLNSPFSWHEYTGKTETPPRRIPLSENLVMIGGYGSGMGIGFGGGYGNMPNIQGMPGQGMPGGLAGGIGGGFQTQGQ